MVGTPKFLLDTSKDARSRINSQAGRCHELSREILDRDWYDTESQARRVIEWIVKQEETQK